MPEPIISVKNLNVVYQKGTASELNALRGVSLDLYPEEFLIIFGPSGCGKSTLLYSISGAEQDIEGGDILFKGANILAMDKDQATMFHRKSVGLIFQAHNLIPTLDILSNVTLPLVFLGMPKAQRKQMGLEILERFGIKEVADKIPSELSGGQQQRAGIARALINNPDVILADEPTGNLDSVSAINVLDILKELNEKFHKTVVLVTHEGQYLPYAQRVIFMKDGKVVNEVKQEKTVLPTAGSLQGAKVGQSAEVTAKQLNKQVMRTMDYLGFHLESLEFTRMEDAIRDYFAKKINKENLFKKFHQPLQDGGVGMYKQKAERMVEDIQEVYEINSIVQGIKTDSKEIASTKIRYLTDWLLKSFHGHLNAEQIELVNKIVTGRVLGQYDNSKFEELLHQNQEHQGAGLNSHTAHNIAVKLEDVF